MQPPSATQGTAVTRQMPQAPADGHGSLPPAPALVKAPGESCPGCGSMIAAGQRYCIDCGERIGDPRLPVMDGRALAQPPQPPAPPAPYAAYGFPPPPAPRSKWSSGTAMLATIALLLLAMGVGVMIGNNGDSKAAAQQPIVIGGTGTTAATGASDATSADASNSATKGMVGDDGKTSAGVDAEALAKKNGVKLAPKDVDLGGKCPKGSVGCNDSGEFDGDYFGN